MRKREDDTRPIGLWRIELAISERQYKLLVKAARVAGEPSVDDWIRRVLVAEAERVLGEG